MMKKKGYKKGGVTKDKKIKAQASALKGEGRMPFNKKSGDYGDTGDRQQRMFMEKMDIPVVKASKGPMKRKPTAAEEARDTRSRLRGTTGGGKPDVNPAYKKGGMMKKKGYAMGGALKGGQNKLDKNKDGKISGDDFAMMEMGGKVEEYGGGGKVKGGKMSCRGMGAALRGGGYTIS
jgi:hypothetical protein